MWHISLYLIKIFKINFVVFVNYAFKIIKFDNFMFSDRNKKKKKEAK